MLIQRKQEVEGLQPRLAFLIVQSCRTAGAIAQEIEKYGNYITNIKKGVLTKIDDENVEKIVKACAGHGYLQSQTFEDLMAWLMDGGPITLSDPSEAPSGGGGLLSVVESATSPRNTGRQTGGHAHSITRKSRAA